ncbi:glycosyl transferase, family 4 [Acidothermus cellulolyticus 11B]|uniref:Glycosyl transferase, family 4 n=1 Tax=Acidothermus cellulolyticus (strain ATCC 43068 / DSM 8971 / 11B) TaxID=351607 RepID=A0LSK7_ACIC1|nr:MraY family glycosyltransferase [Acidothermus cellulolyticus]ABK52417.1 glycosyl transferase, family 4 [Acidothermus cellulolyticus 11B]MCL6550096.1 undecaprenyl/decaprenyl-phosphate alpha-N-acetylglucosaminyl 1-phosphate transferase [Acidothermus cellulolyticus]
MREYLITLLVAASVTYLTTPVARRFAMRIRALTGVRDRDVHSIPTPRLGGLAMLLGVAAAMLVASRLPTLEAVNQRFLEPRALLLGSVIVFVIGALDDRFGLDAVTKLAGQVFAAAVVVLQGVQLLWLPIPAYGTLILGQDWSVILTVTFIVVVINAVNFVDGLDGLAAGIVGIAALAFFALSYQMSVELRLSRALPPLLLAIVVAGVCIGFLPHNFHPARVFMGDSGSMLIGLLLAASTVSLTGQVSPADQYQQYGTFLPLLLPFAVLFVPLADLLAAVVRRTRAGRVPWAPDKQHLHHRLLELGHSQRRAVLIMYGWSAICAAGVVGLAITQAPLVVAASAGAVVLLALVVIAFPRLRVASRTERPG